MICSHRRITLQRLEEIGRTGLSDLVIDLRHFNTSKGKSFYKFYEVSHAVIEKETDPKVTICLHAVVIMLHLHATDTCLTLPLLVRWEREGMGAPMPLSPLTSAICISSVCASSRRRRVLRAGQLSRWRRARPTSTSSSRLPPTRSSSACYTGRFDLCLSVMSRSARSRHPDEHFCAALKRYLQHLVVRYRAYSTFLSLDDKNNIRVGPPGNAVVCVERWRHVLVAKGDRLEASDHDADNDIIKLIPTVTLVVDAPDEVDGEWFTGAVHVLLKSAVWDPSKALRSNAELWALLQEVKDGDEVKPVLFALSDGGSEHRSTFASVWVAITCLYLKGDFDYVCFVRTCPGQSWTNPVERVMAILNIALSGLAIMREKLPDDKMEKLVRNCGSMKELRRRAMENEGVEEAVKMACARAQELIMRRFERMSLKDQPFSPAPEVSKADIDGLFGLTWV